MHRDNAKGGDTVVPALDDFERWSAERKLCNVVPLSEAKAA
jgi:hypothetical protein